MNDKKLLTAAVGATGAGVTIANDMGVDDMVADFVGGIAPGESNTAGSYTTGGVLAAAAAVVFMYGDQFLPSKITAIGAGALAALAVLVFF